MGERLERVLVVYATVSGCTTTIARRIATDLLAYRCRPALASVDETPRLGHDVDAVVFGSGMRVGKWHKEARDWLQDNVGILSAIPVACFSVGLLPATGQAASQVQARRELEGAVGSVGGIGPVDAAALPGWKRSDGLGTMEKLALRVYPLDDGDYRDWDAVDRWVQRMAPQLLGRGPAAGTIGRSTAR